MKKSWVLQAILSSILLVASQSAHAEYRVYQYIVKSRLKSPHAEKGYVVTSTLDPVSYIAYHGGDSSIKVDLLRTWMCKGYTGEGAPICDSPEAKAKKEMEGSP